MSKGAAILAPLLDAAIAKATPVLNQLLVDLWATLRPIITDSISKLSFQDLCGGAGQAGAQLRALAQQPIVDTAAFGAAGSAFTYIKSFLSSPVVVIPVVVMVLLCLCSYVVNSSAKPDGSASIKKAAAKAGNAVVRYYADHPFDEN